MQHKLIFIGGGNMAEAIFGHLPSNKFAITIVQRNLIKRSRLQELYPHCCYPDKLDYALEEDSIVIMAVKPQDAFNSCKEIKPWIQKSYIVSVMAGVTCQTLSKWLNNQKICRAMPNILTQIGLGVTGIYFRPKFTNIAKDQITELFKIVGKVYKFEEEDHLNKITAIAASSPAYILYLMEAMIKNAINLGFSQEDATTITKQIVMGTSQWITMSPNTTITQLRTAITSKKGTTEAAIAVFEQHNLEQIVHLAEAACIKRAYELNQLVEEDSN